MSFVFLVQEASESEESTVPEWDSSSLPSPDGQNIGIYLFFKMGLVIYF